jgi:hypothetical protein
MTPVPDKAKASAGARTPWLGLVCCIAAASCIGKIGGDQGSPGGMATDNPGGLPVHHLTNAEYNATVAHLLGTSLRPADFFPAAAATGFDANVGVLSGMPKVALQGYYDAAAELAADAFANDAQRARILVCEPESDSDTECVRTIVTTFGLRAFRRPLTTEEVDRYANTYATARSALEMPHLEAMQHVVRAMLTSPAFLLRTELDADPTATSPRALNSYELASRLSYLIYSSMPDQPLFDAAASGALTAPDALAEQVDRMLADPKSSAFFDNFFGQWLGIRQLQSHSTDTALYPVWNADVKAAMIDQANTFLAEFTTGDAPWSDFLTAPHPESTLLDPIYASDPDGFRGGFLSIPAFLTLSSLPERSSPTARAKTLIVGLFCTEMAPPANVDIPDLAAAGGEGEVLNVRDKLDKHRADPMCAACHDILDPIGLSMENFDAIGAYRTAYPNGDPIDATGTYDGASFEDIRGLVPALQRDPRLGLCPPDKLFTYAMRRSRTGSDREVIERIAEGWGSGTIVDLLKRVVASDAFRHRVPNPEQ